MSTHDRKGINVRGPAHGQGQGRSGTYFLSLGFQNVRCFSEKQFLDLSDGQGRPARWTILLGENGTGKTTVLQMLTAFEPVGVNIQASALASTGVLLGGPFTEPSGANIKVSPAPQGRALARSIPRGASRGFVDPRTFSRAGATDSGSVVVEVAHDTNLCRPQKPASVPLPMGHRLRFLAAPVERCAALLRVRSRPAVRGPLT